MISLQHTTNQRQHISDFEILIQLLLLNKKNNLHFTKRIVFMNSTRWIKGYCHILGMQCLPYHPLIRLYMFLWFHIVFDSTVRMVLYISLVVMFILSSDKSNGTLYVYYTMYKWILSFYSSEYNLKEYLQIVYNSKHISINHISIYYFIIIRWHFQPLLSPLTLHTFI